MALAQHLRRTFLTGVFAAIPIVATAAVVYYVDLYTRLLAPPIYGHRIPFFGLIVAVVLLYLLGLIVSTALARYLLLRLDSLLDRMPLLQHVYRAWKQVSLNRGQSGMWDKVALVRIEDGPALTLAFTSGEPLPDQPHLLCVFVPSAPAPTTGRLLLLPRSRCQVLPLAPEEAFKHILSGGNYIPDGLGQAALPLLTPPPPTPPTDHPTAEADTPSPPHPHAPNPTTAP